MVRLEDFFTHGDGQFCAGTRAPEDAKPVQHPPVADRGVLYLHGPTHSGQTSLLLQFGFSQIKAGKRVVLVLKGEPGASQHQAADNYVPLVPCDRCGLPAQTGEDNGVWRTIHIKYLRNGTELQQFLCSLHVVDKDTSVLMLDEFEKFFEDQSHMSNVYQTLAYLLEARDYMETSTGTGIAVVTGSTDAFLLRDRPLLRRWCKFLQIKPAGERGEFVLEEEAEKVGLAKRGQSQAVQYEFTARDSESDGMFQLLHVLENE